MDYFYFVVTKYIKESGKYLAYVERVSNSTNLKSVFNNSCFISVNICKTKKQAEFIANRWNEEYKENGIKAVEETYNTPCEAEKQIPKEPIAVPPRLDKVFCPNCRHMQTFANNYCPNCGQRLKWDEDDD